MGMWITITIVSFFMGWGTRKWFELSKGKCKHDWGAWKNIIIILHDGGVPCGESSGQIRYCQKCNISQTR